jgi:TonB family protein
MSENILVVEYEPRYTDRVRQALEGQPFTTVFARDGEEAIRALDGPQPRLIVLSSVVPKVSTTELIRAIRARKTLQETPILLTVSGYNGKSPKADAQRVGASDILPKPYAEAEFLGKVQQLLGLPSSPVIAGEQLTSNEIFGDLLQEEAPVKKATQSRAMGDVDKMLADTLSGVMPQKKKDGGTSTVTSQAERQRTANSEVDKMLSDTLSGLEKGGRKPTSAGNVPRPAVPTPVPSTPAPPPPAAPAPAAAPAPLAAVPAYVPDRVPVAQPVFPHPVAAPKVEEDDATDGVKFGQYVLLEKIATGGMAEVWKARMRGVEGFQKIVAIKKILPHLSDNQDFIEMFVDEAKLAAQLNHNNIIHIYDLGKIQSSYYIAMEYIDGFDLKTILRRGEELDHPMGVELALFVASKVGAALDYAHRKKDFEEKEMGLVHRDVSPQNVLISQEGDIKLCDFGIAKAASKASHTQAGALKGKLQYMSPEQAWGKNIDRRSDVFALAAVLFEMLTGRKLFTGDNEISILEQVREARIQPPSLHNDEVTTEIDRIVLKGLQKDPANRYQTAGEMAREIDAVLYTFRPTPTSADLAIYMHRLSAPESANAGTMHPGNHAPGPAAVQADVTTPMPHKLSPLAGPAPLPVMAPTAVPVSAPVPIVKPEPIPEPYIAAAIPEPIERKSPVGMIAVIALLLAGGAAAAWFMTRKPAASAPAATASVAPVSATQAPLAPAATTTDTAILTPGVTATTATTATLDPGAVDAEVQKRIAAERARLEALARAQQQQAAAAATPARVVPPMAQPAVQQQPPPQQAETRPVVPSPAPQEPATTPAQPAETRPAPAPAQPAVQRAREGDLVAAGTPGLIPPRLVRRGTVTYPSMARSSRIEGTVITNVLVNERGQVEDVKILRGVPRGGLNEAAEQTMRRSTFNSGMKDGVRVKSWVTVPVEFKL